MRTQLYTVRVVVPHNGTFLVGNFAGAHAAREWMDKIKRRLVCELTLERGTHGQCGPTDFERFHEIEKRELTDLGYDYAPGEALNGGMSVYE